MSENDWFDTGYEGLDKADKEYEKRAPDDNELRRVWLKPGQEIELVFETDEPACLWEHQLNMDGHWRNWFTCRRDMEDGCHICDHENDNPAYIGAYVARDMTGWKNKKGELRGVGRRVLYVGKRKTLKQLKSLKEKREARGLRGLKGVRFSITRSDSSSPNCGDLFDALGDEDMAALPEAGPMPNLREYFAPKTHAELQALFGVSGGGTGGGGGKPPEDEDIPF